MKQIGKIAGTYSPAAQMQHSQVKTGSPEKRLPKPVVSALFVRLKSHYGQQWSKRFSNENELAVALIEWGTALVKYSEHEIDAAIASWKRCSPHWAPNLGEFELCCEEAYRNAKPETKTKRIGYIKASPDTVRDNLRQMKQQLGGVKA